MTIRLRTAFIVTVTIFVLWFLYIERVILVPFVLAAIFAFIFNPVVTFLSRRIRLPRSISVILIYSIIVAVIGGFGFFLTKQITNESSELKGFIERLPETTKDQISTLPPWAQTPASDAVSYFENLKVLSFSSIFNFFPEALSGVVSFFIFLFAGFYFLKEGRYMLDRFLRFVPNDYKIEIEILIRKINNVLGRYLRGQLLLVFIVSLMHFIALSILGVKFALILAIFSGILEIVPIIGPIVAGAVAFSVVLITGQIGFGLTPLQGAIVVAIVYFVFRQFEDYFIIPHVMGRLVKLHPLLIFFAALSGGHIGGILGIILAVPIVAALRIVLEFFIDMINQRSRLPQRSR